MNPLNLRDLHGVVHRSLDAMVTDCLHVIQVGDVFDDQTITCVECLAVSTITDDISRRIARVIAQRAMSRARNEFAKILTTYSLQPGDTVDFKHNFDVHCRVRIGQDGSLYFEKEA